MAAALKNRPHGSYSGVSGRIDQYGRVLLPVIIVAADGVELELEAVVNLQYGGALVVPDIFSQSIGWCCLGARKVLIASHLTFMTHYLGLVAIDGEPQNVVVLGGSEDTVIIGQKLLSGRKLSIDFEHSYVTLEASPSSAPGNGGNA